MAGPEGFAPLPSNVKLDPSAIDDVPSDWSAMEAAGTPYVAIIVPHPDDPATPILRWRALAAAGTLSDGYGDNYGNNYGGPE